MKQIIKVDDKLRERIVELENNCEMICKKLTEKYQPEFGRFDYQVVIELTRIKNGHPTSNRDLLEPDYESFIEIGVEYSGEYFPNSSIPIWKCKTEWFQKIGYLTRRDTDQLKAMISGIVHEMLDDIAENNK